MDSQSEYETPHWDDGAYEEIICPPANNICQCQAPGCTEVARYGKINDDTTLIEKHHCKKHKEDGEIGKLPQWRKRYDGGCILYNKKGFKIKDSKETWEKECLTEHYKPCCECLKCGNVIKNPPTISNIIKQGFQCPYCVENERSKERNTRLPNGGHKCDGSCGKKDCNQSFTKSSDLKRHKEAQLKQYICPVPDCPKHEEGYGGKSDMLIHFRDKHNDLCQSDGSCPQYGIPPKKSKPLKKPIKYNGKVTDAEWMFLKDSLVRLNITGDLKLKIGTEDDQKYLKKINNNTDIHNIAEKLVDILVERKLIKDSCIDDAGGYLPNGFDIGPHSLYKLSLDRKDNDRPHFLPNTDNILENLSLIIIGMNNHTSIVAQHRVNTCDYVREKVKESQEKTKEDEDNLVLSQSKSCNIETGIKKQTILYGCCYNIFNQKKNKQYRDKKCREKFETLDNFLKYCYSLLENQRGRCAISKIFLENESAGPRSPFKLSVDAIKPRDGHVPGNIRIICQFLNSTNHDKCKTYVAEDDQETAWTPELFKEYFQIPE